MDTISEAIIEARGTILNSDISHIKKKLKESGLLLLRGYSVDSNSFREFTNSVCTNFVSHLNTSREYFGDRTMMSVSAGRNHFFAHSEMAYSPFRPDIAIFYCVNPASEGGETTVCDGIKVLEQLKSDSRKTLEENELLFEDSMPIEVWKSLAPDRAGVEELYKNIDRDKFTWDFDGDDLRTKYVTSAIVSARWSNRDALATSLLDRKHPCFSDGSAVPRELLWDVIGASEDLMVPIAWQANDILLVDNSRYMHGRRPWKDNKRKIIARFGNIDF